MNKNVLERVYLDDNNAKLQTITHHLERYKFVMNYTSIAGKKIYDLACGSGYGVDMFNHAGAKAIGVDIDENAITYAEIHYPGSTYMRMDLNELAKTKTYLKADIVTMFEAIEHFTFNDGVSLIKNIATSLPDNGLFFMSTPRDVNDKYNKFHLSEWPYFLLKNVCRSEFKDVVIYGQDWDTGIISPDNVRDNDFYLVICTK